MSLSDLASIAIIIQGMLFVISIGLVWYQLRENTISETTGPDSIATLRRHLLNM